MRKPVRSRVLLITGSHISALDFDLLLENLSRSEASEADGSSLDGPERHVAQARGCGTRWASDDDLAPARDFINRQHGAGEPWFCYVNPRMRVLPGTRRSR